MALTEWDPLTPGPPLPRKSPVTIIHDHVGALKSPARPDVITGGPGNPAPSWADLS